MIGFSSEINQTRSNPLQQTLALFFIIITGKVYALSLMHTINSRRAMRERFKSHDLGRTSLSRFQWSEPRTLVDSNILPTPEVSDFRLIHRTSPHPNSHSNAHIAEHDSGGPKVRPRVTSVAPHGKQRNQQLQTKYSTNADR